MAERIPASTFAKNLSKVLDQVEKDGSNFVITRGGKDVAVLIHPVDAPTGSAPLASGTYRPPMRIDPRKAQALADTAFRPKPKKSKETS